MTRRGRNYRTRRKRRYNVSPSTLCGVGIVDPEPWLRRQRDERIAELTQQLKAGGDSRSIHHEIRRARRAYRWAVLQRFLGPRW